MNIEIRYIPYDDNEWSVARAISAVIHSDEFATSEEEKRVNFKIELEDNQVSYVGHNGKGILTLPTPALARKFLDHVRQKPIKLGKSKLKFFRSSVGPPRHVAATLEKTPFVNPDIEEKHVKTMWALEDAIRLEALQFGTYFRPSYEARGRSFSIEWDKAYFPEGLAELKFEFDHKLIRIKLGDPQTEEVGYTVAINFASIRKIAVGHDFGKPYACFDILTPPVIEFLELHRTLTGNKAIDNEKYKWRKGSLDPRHNAVAPYATQIRIIFHNDSQHDKIDEFAKYCKIAGLSEGLIVRFSDMKPLDAVRKGFFAPDRIERFHRALARLPWAVAFQMEALLCNGLLHTGLLEGLLPKVQKLSEQHHRNGSIFVGELLRAFNQVLQTKSTPADQEHPEKILDGVLKTFDLADSDIAWGSFRCGHVTVTPTRMLLEGPYATQSNRIIREYQGFSDNFIRVDFRDEDRLQYRWDRSVDGTTFLRERVGGILKGGFDLAGRSFEFLAYSSSALREHAVWFISPFDFVLPTGEIVRVNGEYIRHNIGDFHGTDLMRHPSKYAARLAQAFTATDPSVELHRDNWEEVPDLGEEPYLFTDGVGTISKELGDRIWRAMVQNGKGRGNVVPSAYQIRFLGYKGVVAVDMEMDQQNKRRKAGEKEIHMRLRPSMRKFENTRVDKAEIEIAQAFQVPNVCYMNRPLVMLLEDLGTRREEFLKLQQIAVADARTIDAGMDEFWKFISGHGLGGPFRLKTILQRFRDMRLDIKPNGRSPSVDTPFLRLLRSVAITDVLRDIKHSARIPIPDSYLLVGIADEGVAYEDAGYKNVYTLGEGQIYACIQHPEDKEPTWIEGPCSISRSPVVHPGDIQRVYAIGKPPEDQICAFRGLVNVVVLPSVGERSLASCLAGGDVDGDLFAVIKNEALLPSLVQDPADYTPLKPELLPHPCTVTDICDFIVEYINSDVLGLLSDRLLIIADQSKQGFMDEACKQLAALCSQAVDYPKQGIPVDLNGFDLPKTLIRCKPDWHAAEVVSPRETDYYRSERALGYLFRDISLRDITEEDLKLSPSKLKPLTDPISQSLMPHVKECIGIAARPSGDFREVQPIFNRYISELDYICVTHTLSNTPGTKLLEAEVVAGTILAKCSQKRMRKERIYRMRTHAESLVKDVQKDLRGRVCDTPERRLAGLKLAWKAWEFSQKFSDKHGANSFGLIALGVVFDCLDGLGVVINATDDDDDDLY